VRSGASDNGAMVVDSPPTAPSPEDLEALIREARERQRRRRLVNVAGVALAAAVGISLYAVTTGQTRTPHARNALGGGPPLCRASQLSTSAGLSGAAGTALVPTFITNTSPTACALPAGRPLAQITFRGKPIPTRERSWPSGMQFGPRAGRVLSAGSKVYVEVGWRGFCPRPAQAPTSGGVMVSLLFRGGLRVSAPETTPEGVPGIPGCGESSQPPPWLGVSPPLRLH
jgi:hypothetical protein